MVTAPPDVLNDAAFWASARRRMVAVALPIFREAFLIGAALGANTAPRSDTEAGEREKALAALVHRATVVGIPTLTLAGLLAGAKDRVPGVDENLLPIPGPDGRTLLPFDAEQITGATDAFIESYTDRWWSQVETTTRERMRTVMRRAAAEGLTINQITAQLDPLFGPGRARVIAVSETTNLMGKGAQLTYERAGFGGWIWRTARDTDVDPSCVGLSRASDPQFGGTPFPITRPFERAHVGCRCWPVAAGKPTARAGGVAPGGKPIAKPPIDTTELHTVDGKWTAARERLHDDIVREFLSEATPVDSPTAYVMGGGPASGKSTVIDRGLVDLPKNIVKIDSDAIKLRLPEYQQMVKAGDSTAAAFSHEESSYLSKRLVREASDSKRNLLLDGTGDSSVDSLAKKIADMRRGGHRVVGNYVSLDTELAVKLSEARAIKTGREVPYDFLRDTHRAVSQTLPQAIERNLFDELKLFDTNINGQPRQVLSMVDGKVTINDRALWRDFVVKGEAQPGSFAFEATARYAEDASAAITRERIVSRPDVAAMADREARLERLMRSQKELLDGMADVYREQSRNGLSINDAAPDSPYGRWRANRKALADEIATLEGDIERLGAQMADSILTAESIYAETAATFEVDAPWIGAMRDRTARERLQRGVNDFKRLVGPNSPVQGKRLQITRHSASRDYYTPGTNRLMASNKSRANEVVHEMGHWLEDNSTATQALRREHVDRRTVGERARRLSDLKPGWRYKRTEIAFKDEFMNPYIGKVYPDKRWSEVVSMGLEEMYRRPWLLARADPKLFDFIFDLLQGWR